MVIEIINELRDMEYQLTVKYMNNKTVENWDALFKLREYLIKMEDSIGLAHRK